MEFKISTTPEIENKDFVIITFKDPKDIRTYPHTLEGFKYALDVVTYDFFDLLIKTTRRKMEICQETMGTNIIPYEGSNKYNMFLKFYFSDDQSSQLDNQFIQQFDQVMEKARTYYGISFESRDDLDKFRNMLCHAYNYDTRNELKGWISSSKFLVEDGVLIIEDITPADEEVVPNSSESISDTESNTSEESMSDNNSDNNDVDMAIDDDDDDVEMTN